MPRVPALPTTLDYERLPDLYRVGHAEPNAKALPWLERSLENLTGLIGAVSTGRVGPPQVTTANAAPLKLPVHERHGGLHVTTVQPVQGPLQTGWKVAAHCLGSIPPRDLRRKRQALLVLHRVWQDAADRRRLTGIAVQGGCRAFGVLALTCREDAF